MFRSTAIPGTKPIVGTTGYQFGGARFSLADYMARYPRTGLPVAKDEQILFEKYRYDRTDLDRFVSQSMVKSISGILIGIAKSEGAIKSVDDTAEAYAPVLNGREYGATSIRDLLHLSSGVDFGEVWNDMVLGSGLFKKGTVRSIAQFNLRIALPGTRYYYASIEPDVLGIFFATPSRNWFRTIFIKRFGMRLGAEADAKWRVKSPTSVLRCCATTRGLAACSPRHVGRQRDCTSQRTIDATTVRASSAYLLPGRARRCLARRPPEQAAFPY